VADEAVQEAVTSPGRTPKGSHDLILDEKGRLKLPAAFHRYLTDTLKDSAVVVTTLDERVARIYPFREWEKVEEFFRNCKEEPERADRIWRLSQHYGVDTEVDSVGRLSLPARLKERLALGAKSKVWLMYNRGFFELSSDEVYQQDFAVSNSSPRADLAVLRTLGMP
jgi:MraZ protein